MANLPIDSNKITLVATGKVRPVPLYAEDAAGNKQRVPGAQDKCPRTNKNLFAVDVMLDDDEDKRSEAISVKVPADVEPVVAKWQPVIFSGLTCKPYIKQGVFQPVLSMSATGIEAPGAPASSSRKSSPASASTE